MSWNTAHGQTKPSATLLPDRAGEKALTQQLELRTATFVDGEFSVDRVEVMRGQPSDPAVPVADLFVARGHQNQIAIERQSPAVSFDKGHELGRHLALHIQRAATPDEPVVDFAAEGIVGPVLPFHPDDIEVTHQQQWPLD